MERRDVLIGLSGAGLVSALPKRLLSQPVFAADPFTLGVASGSPTPYGMTLWTRLAPSPLEPAGGLDPVALPVRWELAADEGLQQTIASGTAIARPELAHSVRVQVGGLEPGRHYWYRFTAGDAQSMTGRTKTLPDPYQPLSELRFATASCQHFEQGLFVAYDHMIADDVDFIIHLGDYIYGVSRGDFRDHVDKEEPETLEQHRRRHAQYKTDPSLQRAHASFPFFTVLDNHDALKDVDLDPTALAKRAAAYQAWFEHMPMAGGYTPGGASIHTHAAADFGDLLRLTILDTRQFRDNEDICRDLADPDFGFTIYRPACDPVEEASRSMLGAAQEAWVAHQFRTSEQRWNALASTVLFSPFAMHRNNDIYRYESSWDYFPANRRRVIQAMQAAQLANPMVLSADIHSNWAIDIKADPDDPESATIGTEMLATSIASGWPPPLDDPMRHNLANNPHVHHYEGAERGYLLHHVTPSTWTTEMRVVDDITTSDAKISTQARFVVEDGRPGVQKG